MSNGKPKPTFYLAIFILIVGLVALALWRFGALPGTGEGGRFTDEEMQRHVIDNFRRHLRTGGYLFLGHSEIMLRREGWRPAAVTVYQKTS